MQSRIWSPVTLLQTIPWPNSSSSLTCIKSMLAAAGGQIKVIRPRHQQTNCRDITQSCTYDLCHLAFHVRVLPAQTCTDMYSFNERIMSACSMPCTFPSTVDTMVSRAGKFCRAHKCTPSCSRGGSNEPGLGSDQIDSFALFKYDQDLIQILPSYFIYPIGLQWWVFPPQNISETQSGS